MIDINYIKGNKLLLLEVVSGSQAYGLATADSDTDIKGVFYLPREYFFSNTYISQVNNDSNDIMYYELGKFIELLCKNNPNILEMLATPEPYVLYRHPLMAALKPELFVSKLTKETFAGYAYTQIKKAKGLNKKFNNPIPQERKTVLDFCHILQENNTIPLTGWLALTHRQSEHCGLAKLDHTKGIYALYYNEQAGYRGVINDDSSNEVCCSSIDKEAPFIAYLFFNQEAYSVHCKSYREYWSWVEKRNEIRFIGNHEHGKGYDAKNMMHTIRLLQVVKELFETGELHVFRKNREQLLNIKRGNESYDDLVWMANGLMEAIELAASNSNLPDTPDEAQAKQILLTIREKLYNVTTD